MGSLLARTVTKHSRHRAILPKSLIVGGESTVHVTSNGVGGRNQEVALSAVEGVDGLEGIAIAALGTDGIDGNTRAAGAIIDGDTAIRAKSKRLDPNALLVRNDSGRFFEKLGDAIITGPTGTNVGDIYLAISLR
jgi:glycerate-2-kinase